MLLLGPPAVCVNEPKNQEIIALRDVSKNTFLVELKNETIKIKGIGVFNPLETIKNNQFGEKILIGTKEFVLLPAS